MCVCVCVDIYHCVFGDLEESLQSCCHEAMESASKGKLRTIVFWLDGFISISGKNWIYVRSYIMQCSIPTHNAMCYLLVCLFH